MSKELALYLAQERMVARWQMANAVEVYDSYPDSLCDNLVRLNYLDEKTYLAESSEFYGVEIISGERLTAVPARILSLLPRDVAARHKVLPLAVSKNVLTCAVKLPVSMQVLQQLRMFTGYNIQPVITRHDALRRALARFYSIEIPPLTVSDQVREKYDKRRPLAEGDVSDAAALTTGTVIPEVRDVGKGPAAPMGERNAVKMRAVADKVDAALTHDEPVLELDGDVGVGDERLRDFVAGRSASAKNKAALNQAALTLPPGEGPIELTPNYATESESAPANGEGIELEPVDEEPAVLELVSEPGGEDAASGDAIELKNVSTVEMEAVLDQIPEPEPDATPEPTPQAEAEPILEPVSEEPAEEAEPILEPVSEEPAEEPQPAPEPEPEPPAPQPPAAAAPSAASWGAELDALNEMLSEASKTDEIIEAALDFLAGKAPRVLFMAMKKKQLAGHSGRGVPEDMVKQCSIDYSLISLIRSAVENMQPYVGQPFEDDAIKSLVDVIGHAPTTVVVIPVHIKDKPVGLLYLDDAGDDGSIALDHGFATSFRKLVSAAFETLILARKLGV